MAIGTMLFNPFTGTPRHPCDIASDPKGILIWDGEEPLRAAKPDAAQSHIVELEAEQASRRTYRASVLEEALEACEALRERDHDEAWQDGIGDCKDAIRALAEKTQGEQT